MIVTSPRLRPRLHAATASPLETLNFKTYARFKYLARRLAVVTKKVPFFCHQDWQPALTICRNSNSDADPCLQRLGISLSHSSKNRLAKFRPSSRVRVPENLGASKFGYSNLHLNT